MKNRIKLRREVSHGGVVPAGWRMAWYEPRRRVGVYFPPPLHWLIRALREFGYRVHIAINAPPIERAEVFELQRSHHQRQLLADQYSCGYLAGWRECYDVCLETVEDEISRANEIWEVGQMLAGAPKPPRKN